MPYLTKGEHKNLRREEKQCEKERASKARARKKSVKRAVLWVVTPYLLRMKYGDGKHHGDSWGAGKHMKEVSES